MRWVALLALGACNSIFGNDRVVAGDARFFDAPIDGGVHCPAFGTAPRFSPVIHPVIDQNCGSYVVAADTQRAYAVCGGLIFGGPVDRPLEVEPDLPTPGPDFSIATPRVSPEGTLMLLGTFDLTNTVSTYRSYMLAGTTWTRGADLRLPQFGNMSVPSRGPDRRVLFYDQNVGKEFREDASGVWTEARSVRFGPLPGVHSVWLAPDALRFLTWEQASDGNHLYYADRANRDDDFSAPRLFTGLPPTPELFITEDCTRAYMNGVEEIFVALGE